MLMLSGEANPARPQDVGRRGQQSQSAIRNQQFAISN
jgi:hypothetical protein